MKKDFTTLRDDQLEYLGFSWHEEGCYWCKQLDGGNWLYYHKATNEVELPLRSRSWTKCVRNEAWLEGFIEAADFLP